MRRVDNLRQVKGMSIKEYQRIWWLKNRDKLRLKRKEQNKIYCANNREKVNLKNKNYRDSHPIFRKNIYVKHRIYVGLHKEKIKTWHRKYNQERKKIDSNFRMTINLRRLLLYAFDNFSKHGKVMSSRKYGINFEAIIKHLGKCPGHRKEWHIHHIKPLCYFNFDDTKEVKQAFAPENHEWLPAYENLSRGAKWEGN